MRVFFVLDKNSEIFQLLNKNKVNKISFDKFKPIFFNSLKELQSSPSFNILDKDKDHIVEIEFLNKDELREAVKAAINGIMYTEYTIQMINYWTIH